jgi:hypothetical protein
MGATLAIKLLSFAIKLLPFLLFLYTIHNNIYTFYPPYNLTSDLYFDDILEWI